MSVPTARFYLLPKTLSMFLLLSLFILAALSTAWGQSAPAGLRATAASGSVGLAWNSYSGASSFNIYRSLTSGGEGTTPVVTGISGSATSYTNSSLTNSTTYYFQVTAVVLSVETSHSNEASATPGSTALGAPVLKGIGSSGQASLTWGALSGATSYNLYRSSSAGSSMIQIGLTSTTFSDTGLTNTVTYTYTVYPVSSNGQGTASNAVPILPGAAALAAPGLTAAEASSTSINLDWTAITGASTYDLYRSTSSGGEGAVPFMTNVHPGTSISYTDRGLSSSNTYYYEVVAVGTGGEGSLSNEASATPGSALLAAPILKGVGSSGQVALAWSAVSGATSYDVYRVGGPILIELPYRVGISGTSFTDTGLSNTTSYTYMVYAADANGQGTGSNSVSVSPGAAPLAAPILTATEASSTSINLNWTAITGATTYDLYRGTSSGGEGAAPFMTNISSGGSISYTDAGLSSSNTYYYKAVAVGAGGEGALSNEASATPGSALLAAPILKAVGSSGQVALTWSAVSGAVSYNLYRVGGPILIELPYQVGISGTSFTDTGLSNTPSYTYMVYAVDTNGQGTGSNPVTASPGATPLAAPALWASPVSGVTSINLNWIALTGATSYDLYRSTTSGGEGSTPIKVLISGTSYTDSGLTLGTEYYYELSAVGAGGEGALSNEATAIVGDAPLAAPTGFTQTVAPDNGTTITLAWNSVTGASSYAVFRDEDATLGHYVLAPYASGVTSTSYVDTVTVGHSYIYEVCAVNSTGYGAFTSMSPSLSLYGFALSPNPSAITVTHGTLGATSILATPSGGYTGTVQFTGTGLPTGVTAWFYPDLLTFQTPNPTPIYTAGYLGQFTYAMISTNVYFAALSTASPGTYTIDITATSTGADGFTYTTPVTLTIN